MIILFYFFKERKRKENKKKKKKVLAKKRLKKKKEKKIGNDDKLRRKTSSALQLHSIERKKGLEREKKENKVIRVKMGRYQQKRKGKEGEAKIWGGGGKGKCQD